MERSPHRVNHQGHLAEWSRREVCFAEVPVRPVAAEIAAGLQCGKPLAWLETAPTLDRIVEGRAVPPLPANAPESCPTT